jgi:hypothetical protein
MGKTYDAIDDNLAEFIRAQHVFFVASAPLARDGHVNVSPKGLDTLRVLGPRKVAYLDLTGSGIETLAHARENGRITLMFCAFEGRPLILRVYGRATAHDLGTPGFDALLPHFEVLPGMRSIVEVDVTRIADSCGWGVPRMRYEADRDQLPKYAQTLGPERTREAKKKYNSRSLDGLPGLTFDSDS